MTYSNIYWLDVAKSGKNSEILNINLVLFLVYQIWDARQRRTRLGTKKIKMMKKKDEIEKKWARSFSAWLCI